METTTSCKTITSKVYNKEMILLMDKDEDIKMLKNNKLFASCTNIDQQKNLNFFS